MFKRKIYNKLLKRKEEYKGTRAVLIEGARRIGKSTIVEEFAKKEYKSYILIDFANVSANVLKMFDDIYDLDLFFLRLQAEYNINLFPRESVIIFDEVQLFPRARQAIKYLVRDGKYDYIETGSLISIKKNVKDILIPSEEIKLEMYPMDYEEFCDAVGFNYLVLKKLFDLNRPIGEATNRKLIRDFRIYMAVGGMPQAVEAFVQKKSFNKIDEIKREIIDLYKSDLRKIDPTGRLSKIFESVPAQLAAKRNRFSLKTAIKTTKTSKDEERIFDLIDSKIVNICNHVTEPSISINQSIDLTRYKFYLSDTGLFVTMLFNSDDKSHESIYKKMLSNKLDSNLGYLYENVIAQLLVSSSKKLYYYTWNKENSTHKYEIDFLIVNKNKVSPIEVKSGRINNHESIDNYSKKYSRLSGAKYIISTKDIGFENDIILKPFYLFELCLEKM